MNTKNLMNLSAAEYFKKSLMPAILSDYDRLSAENGLIVIEGAGSFQGSAHLLGVGGLVTDRFGES